MKQGEESSLLNLSPRERRILQWMKDGNRIFEVIDKKYFIVYDDRADRDHRVKKEELDALERAGWIMPVPNPDRQHLDSWEVSEQWQAALTRGL